MATEKNPFEQIEKEITNVIQLPEKQEGGEPSFEVEPDGGLTVDFSSTEESIEMGASTEVGEWYGNLADKLDEDTLEEISNSVYDNYVADKDSRGERESMFERGFD